MWNWVKKMRFFTYCRQKNAIFPPQIHTIWETPYNAALQCAQGWFGDESGSRLRDPAPSASSCRGFELTQNMDPPNHPALSSSVCYFLFQIFSMPQRTIYCWDGILFSLARDGLLRPTYLHGGYFDFRIVWANRNSTNSLSVVVNLFSFALEREKQK